MPSWILIPAYLFKNSIYRWFENLASPATKLLIPFLLTLLGLAVFGFLRGLEEQLQEQLQQRELRTIRTVETVFSRDAPERLAGLDVDARLWRGFCERYESFQQVAMTGAVNSLDRLPILVYDEPLSFVEMPDAVPGEPEEVFLLAAGDRWGERADILIKDYAISAMVLPLPAILQDYYQKLAVILVPQSLAEPVMEEGFSQVQILVPRPDVSPARLENLLKTQARLEDRQVRVDSSVGTLSRLEKLLQGQRLVRLVLGVALALILSLILGALALLEFRHESYIVALLRSFGVRGWALAVHYFLENLFLTLAGLALGVLVFMRGAERLLVRFSDELPGEGVVPSFSVQPSSEDLKGLAAAAIVGVVLAVVPVLWGLRKKPGLILS